MQNGWSCIKDSGDFIKKINNLDSIPENAISVKADAVGLYPSIPHEVCLRALREALDKRDEKIIPTEKLLKMAVFVLKNNYFEFGNKIKQQISGTAIGTKFAPPDACIFMSDLETKFLEGQHTVVWLRYIDDIFWSGPMVRIVKKFFDELNDFNQYIKFTYDYSAKNIPFLDLKVGLKDGKITTDLHVKPTDRHQYFHFSSAHPNHTKRSLVFSQTLSMSRLCSNESDFERNKEKMRSWFVKREYPEKLIDSEIRNIKFNIKETNNKNKSQNGVPLAVTYHPLLDSLSGIIRKSLYLLNMDQKFKEVFSSQLMVSFRSARKLSSYLVRAKLYPLERRVSSYKYRCNRCQVCRSITETETFICNNDQSSYKINYSFDCNEKFLIYLLTCNCCQKQYVGQTVDIFRNGWNNYKDNARQFDRGEHCMQRHLYEHFTLPGHSGFLHDVSITLIDKTDPSCPTKREDYWIDILKGKAPMGLNFDFDDSF